MDLSTMIMEVVWGPEIIALVALMVANVLLAIIAALYKGEFSFRNLADFVPNRIMPLIAYIVVAILASVVDGWTAVAIAVYTGLIVLYGAGITAALKALTGINIPEVFTEKRRE